MRSPRELLVNEWLNPWQKINYRCSTDSCYWGHRLAAQIVTLSREPTVTPKVILVVK